MIGRSWAGNPNATGLFPTSLVVELGGAALGLAFVKIIPITPASAQRMA